FQSLLKVSDLSIPGARAAEFVMSGQSLLLQGRFLGAFQKSFGGGGEPAFGPHSANAQRLRRGRKWDEFQARPRRASQGLRRKGHTVSRFDRGDQAADAVVFLRDAWFAFDGGKHGCQILV